MIISSLMAGGAQRVVTTMARALSLQGYRVCVVTLDEEHTDFFQLDDEITRIALGATGESATMVSAVSANLTRVLRLRRAIRVSGAPSVMSFMTMTNILTVLATLGLGRHVVISERNDPDRQSFGPLWDRLRRWLYRFANVTTANSRGALENLSLYVPAGRLRYVPNPAPELPPEPDAHGRERAILTVGRLTWQKGHDVLLDAFARVAHDAPDWRLVVVGEGDLGEVLRSQARDLGVDEHVEWVGPISDVRPYYGRASIFVLASRFEGTPNALLEAMSFGLPSVVTDASPGPLEYVEPGVSGSVVPVDDAGALAKAMGSLIGSEEMRREFGANARARIAQESLGSVLAAWADILSLPPR